MVIWSYLCQEWTDFNKNNYKNIHNFKPYALVCTIKAPQFHSDLIANKGVTVFSCS